MKQSVGACWGTTPGVIGLPVMIKNKRGFEVIKTWYRLSKLSEIFDASWIS